MHIITATSRVLVQVLRHMIAAHDRCRGLSVRSVQLPIVLLLLSFLGCLLCRDLSDGFWAGGYSKVKPGCFQAANRTLLCGSVAKVQL